MLPAYTVEGHQSTQVGEGECWALQGECWLENKLSSQQCRRWESHLILRKWKQLQIKLPLCPTWLQGVSEWTLLHPKLWEECMICDNTSWSCWYSLESSSQMKHSLTEEALLSAVTLKHSTFLWLELHLRTKNVCKHQQKKKNRDANPLLLNFCEKKTTAV